MAEVDRVVPFGTKVLAKPLPVSEITDGGIFLPSVVNRDVGNPGHWAEVVKVGSEYNEHTGDDISPGDIIVYQKLATAEIIIDLETYLLITSTDHPRGILAKVDSSL